MTHKVPYHLINSELVQKNQTLSVNQGWHMSTRHYTINQFFRQMPNELLARYFYSCSEFKGFDFKSAEDINPQDLLRQWSSLPEDVRTEHEITFREIHSLSCEKGFYAVSYTHLTLPTILLV